MNFDFDKCIINIREEQILLLVIYTENKASADYTEEWGKKVTTQTMYV